MNKLTILFLTMLLTCLPMAMRADSHKEKRDDTRYLAGAVPVVDGKVVFSKEFQIPGMSQKQIYDTVMKWMNKRLKENNNPDSRIVFSDEAQGTIAGVGEEWITFYSSALSLDRTWVNYQITVTCKPGSCLVELEKIRFTYRETEKYKAEEWITDEYALNKSKTKLVRGLAKWRRKTVDFADDIFMDVAVAFGAPDTRPKSEKKKKEPRKPVGFIAVSIGEGMNGIFRELGADYIIEGGQTMNPSTDDMLSAIDEVNADHIFILPNNKNIILAANQAQSLTDDKDIIVIPTKTVPQGITAIISYMPEADVDTNIEALEEAIKNVKTGQVTYAVRDTHIDDKEIHEGDIMGIGDRGILAVGQSVEETTKEMLAQLVDEESELISLYFGQDVLEEDAENFAQEVEELYPDVDVDVHMGGQPIYYYVLSVE